MEFMDYVQFFVIEIKVTVLWIGSFLALIAPLHMFKEKDTRIAIKVVAGIILVGASLWLLWWFGFWYEHADNAPEVL